jgi:hypothetical protein
MSFECTRLRRIRQLLADAYPASDITWTTES